MRNLGAAALVWMLLLVSGCLETQGNSPDPADAANPDSPDRELYVRALKAKARAMKLGQSEQWMRLGHWRQSWTGNYESEADGENFYLSPRGPTLTRSPMIMEVEFRFMFIPFCSDWLSTIYCCNHQRYDWRWFRWQPGQTLW